MLGVQNRDSVRWRCRFHGVVWVATVASRTQNVDRLGGCARCRGERMGETVRSAIPREGSRIVEVERPDIAAEFVENVTTPGRGPDRFTIYCKDEVRWRCSVCEFEYEQTVGARLARINPRCSNCNTGGHRLLEVQCAALVSAQLDVEVLLGQRIANLRPDLWLPVQRVGVDLDPEWSHRAHLERDIRKGAACMGAMNGFARIREAGLPPSGTWDYWVSCDADIDMWADAAIRAIESLTSLSRSHLDSQQRLDVLHSSAQRWIAEQSDPYSRSFAARYPDISARFVANLTRPGIGPHVFAANSNYDCIWQCVHGFSYKTRPQTVARGGGAKDCPDCAAARGTVLAARMAGIGRAGLGKPKPAVFRARHDARWDFMHAILANFIQREGHALVPGTHSEWEVPLGRWVAAQRGAHRRGELRPERIDRLEALPGWFWNLRASEGDPPPEVV